MRLLQFRVTSFRSVVDSGWVDLEQVTAFVGGNESGKTNLLLPLWKLNPAREGAIDLTADAPRKDFSAIRASQTKPVFIAARFEMQDALVSALATETGYPPDALRRVEVTRDFDGKRRVKFIDAGVPTTIDGPAVRSALAAAHAELQGITPMTSETGLVAAALAVIVALSTDNADRYSASAVDGMLARLQSTGIDKAPKGSSFRPRYERLVEEIAAMRATLDRTRPEAMAGVADRVIAALPTFVYYSSYGNLDSEIYLPQVIQNLTRTDLGAKEAARSRTLRVLFDFVRLRPSEILELGNDVPGGQETPATIAAVAEKKKERTILLDSASTDLTKRFRDWWRQGDYTFAFTADGNHFRIWVADDRRPERVELESRSTGLQWFLSFFLVFLVERAGEHRNAILLLDEPGVSLHPLAQRDLTGFFENLSRENQVLYTTHSPFLIDPDHLERARKVYVDEHGASCVTADLRVGGGDVNARAGGYAVVAAVGLTVADTLLYGCIPVVVEGPSDQHYLSVIKNLLVAAGRIRPSRDIIFVPGGGARPLKVLASVLGARDDALPVSLLDGDRVGRDAAAALRRELYVGREDRVIDVGAYCSVADGEVEDLLPSKVLARHVDRMYRDPTVPFEDVVVGDRAFVPQVTAWAASHGVTLETPGWKMQLATRAKGTLLAAGPDGVPPDILDRWQRLFDDIAARATAT